MQRPVLRTARTILEDNATAPAGNNMPQVPGFAILIADARAQAIPGAPVLNQISHQPVGTDEIR